MKKIVNICLLLAILFTISFIIYFSRQIFNYHYDPVYYDNYYYHSQWNIPNSTRGISDGELYKFIGYRLASGENPFDINFEVPPFAKLLYGLAEKYFGNPYIVSLIFYLLSVLVIYKFSLYLFSNSLYKTLLTTLLFVTTPFVATQIKETMLDLPLTFFFLSQSYFFVIFLSNKKIKYLIFSGIFLGLATGTKIGVYTPSLIIACLLILFLDKSVFKVKIKRLFVYSLSTFAGYCFAFISYFVKHPNPFPWLRLHQKQLDFYLKPQSIVDHLSPLKNIFLNQYHGFLTSSQGNSGDWSPILLIGTVILIPLLIYFIKNKKYQQLYLVLFCLVIIITNCFIPFFPRYLMPLIPIFVLLIAFTFQKYPLIIYLLIIFNFIFLYQSMTVDRVNGHAGAVARFISTRNYPELYRSLYFDKNITEDEFSKILEYFYTNISTKKIKIDITNINQNQYRASAIFDIKYQTNYGLINNKIAFTFKKTDNQWKTIWNWNYLWPNYSPESKIYINPVTTKKITEIFIIPQDMHDWGKSITQVREIAKEDVVTLDQNIKTNIPDKYSRYIGTLKQNTNHVDYHKVALSIPGVSLKSLFLSAQVYFIKDNQKIFIIN